MDTSWIKRPRIQDASCTSSEVCMASVFRRSTEAQGFSEVLDGHAGKRHEHRQTKDGPAHRGPVRAGVRWKEESNGVLLGNPVTHWAPTLLNSPSLSMRGLLIKSLKTNTRFPD